MFLKEEIKKEIGFTFSGDTQFVKRDGNLKLVKENGKLTGAVFSKIENGEVYDVQNYRLGNNEATPMLVDNIKERIKIYCEKAKDSVLRYIYLQENVNKYILIHYLLLFHSMDSYLSLHKPSIYLLLVLTLRYLQ